MAGEQPAPKPTPQTSGRDPAEWLLFVAAGRVKMIKHSESGRETILATFGPGQVVGEVGVLADMTRNDQTEEPVFTAAPRPVTSVSSGSTVLGTIEDMTAVSSASSFSTSPATLRVTSR